MEKQDLKTIVYKNGFYGLSGLPRKDMLQWQNNHKYPWGSSKRRLQKAQQVNTMAGGFGLACFNLRDSCVFGAQNAARAHGVDEEN